MITPEEAIACLKKLEEYVTSPRDSWHKKGYEFEKRFASMCELRGMVAERAGRGHFDYLVNEVRVQCKCLVPDQSGMVYVQPGSGPAYKPGSFDVLVVETPAGVHVIPESDIPRTKKSGLLRAALSVDFLAKYLDAWWVLTGVELPQGFERQLKLGLIDEEAMDGR
jgi:hypothetical protein